MHPAHPPPQPQPRLRILCLHGYGGSSHHLRSKLAPLASTLSPFAELVYADSPSGGWWAPPRVYEGFRCSLEHLVSFIEREGPFDGVLGFSQGAVLAGLLSAFDCPFTFAILVAGFIPRSPRLSRMYQGEVRVPSLHVYGRRDENVRPAESEELVRWFVDPVVVVHVGGHVVPSDDQIVGQVVEFVGRQWGTKFGR